ncbi:MAG: hypothetical protein JO295_14135 [Verrucomicrobia bacterium]|nr:hypothetical protein [Verrucomicrobiota bacterium]
MGLSSFNLPSSIHLDYGADSAPFACRDVHVSSRGVRLKSRCRFDAGTEIALDVVLGVGTANGDHAGTVPQRFRLAGVVVDCQMERVPAGSSAPSVYQLTLLFWEKTEEIDALLQALENAHRTPAPPSLANPHDGLFPSSPSAPLIQGPQ